MPPPLDADFFEIAGRVKGHGTPRLARRVLRDVWDLYGRISGITLEGYYGDIEARAEISRFAKSANKPKDWQRRKKNLEELIRRVFIHTTCKNENNHLKPQESELHKRILGKLEKTDTLVTFNYDLLIEESFGKGCIWNPKGGYGDAVHGFQRSGWSKNWIKERKAKGATNSQLRLLKLHGSLNWRLYKTGHVRLKDRPFVVRSGKPEEVSILPPGWNKKVNKNPYKQFWREARLRLEQCKSIVVIGYSLPDSDLLAKALFAEVVRLRAARKNYIDQIHLADPSESIKQKFIGLFVPALNPQSKIFRYQDIKEFSSV